MSGRRADPVTHSGSRAPLVSAARAFILRFNESRSRGVPPRAHMLSRPLPEHSLKHRENTVSLPVTAVTKTSFAYVDWC